MPSHSRPSGHQSGKAPALAHSLPPKTSPKPVAKRGTPATTAPAVAGVPGRRMVDTGSTEGGEQFNAFGPLVAQLAEWIRRNMRERRVTYTQMARLAADDGVVFHLSRVARWVAALERWQPGQSVHTDVRFTILWWMNVRVFGRTLAEMEAFLVSGEAAEDSASARAQADALRANFAAIRSPLLREQVLRTTEQALELDHAQRQIAGVTASLTGTAAPSVPALPPDARSDVALAQMETGAYLDQLLQQATEQRQQGSPSGTSGQSNDPMSGTGTLG